MFDHVDCTVLSIIIFLCFARFHKSYDISWKLLRRSDNTNLPKMETKIEKTHTILNTIEV